MKQQSNHRFTSATTLHSTPDTNRSRGLCRGRRKKGSPGSARVKSAWHRPGVYCAGAVAGNNADLGRWLVCTVQLSVR